MTGKYQLGNITGQQVTVGDHNTVNVSAQTAPALDELSRRVEHNAAAVQEIEAVLAQLREELQQRPPRRERIQALLATLTTGAGALTAMVEGIDKLRQSIGLSA